MGRDGPRGVVKVIPAIFPVLPAPLAALPDVKWHFGAIFRTTKPIFRTRHARDITVLR